MTKSELIERGEEFYETLEFEFRDYDIIEVGKEGFDYYRGSPMYGCLVHVDVNDLSDDEYDEIEETIKGVCNRWDEHTDYGWDDNLGAFWVALYIDEITPDPVVVDDSECPECGASLVENDDGVLYCPYCNPEMEEMEGDEDEVEDEDEDEDEEKCCEDCGEYLEEDDDGNLYCPACRQEDEEICEECGGQKEQDDDGEWFCPDCRKEEQREKEEERRDDCIYDGVCPFCGTELEGDPLEPECPQCGWDEDYEGDGEMCPMCEILLTEEGGVLACPQCGWTEEECPYCGEPTYIDDDDEVRCRECGWSHNYDGDGEVCPECDHLLIQEDGWYKCPNCDWSQLDDKSDWGEEEWERYWNS